MSSVTNSLIPQGSQAEISPRRQEEKSKEEAFVNSSRTALKVSSKASTSVSAALGGNALKGALVCSGSNPVTGVLLNYGIDQATSTAKKTSDIGFDYLVDSKLTEVVLTTVKKTADSSAKASQKFCSVQLGQ